MQSTSKDGSWQMNLPSFRTVPRRAAYDVIVIGGATLGPSTAWFLASSPDFKARALIVEPDPTLAKVQTGASDTYVRRQFANPINVRIGQFAADFVKSFRANLGGDPAVPDLTIRNFGYLYLSHSPALTKVLRRDQRCGPQARWHPHCQPRRDFRRLSLLTAWRYRGQQPEHPRRGPSQGAPDGGAADP